MTPREDVSQECERLLLEYHGVLEEEMPCYTLDRPRLRASRGCKVCNAVIASLFRRVR